ncbi:MAG: tyrosine-type recombinase/integrase [Opitutus sp.]|nr:tyrosine-type recombinase/integrase [Opitutus sp.]MCS6246384.1 tyrosine-type recombinase/integrase [Opitutus sp.]MCS6273242.1 tyrosine-type recombinase/integrase [Opitutus sp.]MCS6277981.1 tyrosine-type recombinase/integrase [Opitutus sp.]MCS6298911.1 tyrosine-type recombinase/integrase [Opitutus sp.]
MKAIGLPALLQELRPEKRPERSATVGEVIAAAKLATKARASSFNQYEVSMRRLVAGVLGMVPTKAVFAHGSDAALEWRAKIEKTSLDVLTDARVEQWRKNYLAAAPDEVARLRSKNTAAAIIRNARALLAPDMVKAFGGSLRIPTPAPLSGLSIGGSTRRFKSTTDPRQLYADALVELSGDTLAAFLLCLTAGLRRGEVDSLPWAHLDLDAGVVHVQATKWFLPKTEESQRSTPIQSVVVKLLRAHRAANPDADMVLAGLDASKARSVRQTRCKCWVALRVWLRKKGFTTPNPVHELRKLSGSMVNASAGIEAARRHLGHRNTSTTSASYIVGAAAMVDLTSKPSAK